MGLKRPYEAATKSAGDLTSLYKFLIDKSDDPTVSNITAGELLLYIADNIIKDADNSGSAATWSIDKITEEIEEAIAGIDAISLSSTPNISPINIKRNTGDSVQVLLNKIYGQLSATHRELGILRQNLFASSGEITSDFVQTGGTFSFNTGGGLSVSGGTGDFLKKLTSTWKTLLMKYSLTIEFTNTTAGNGIALGFTGLFGRIDLNAAGDRGKLYLANSTTALTDSGSSLLSFVDTDVIRLTLSRDGNIVTLKAVNITNTSVAPVEIKYSQSLSNPSTPPLQVFASPAIYAYGGTQLVTQFTYETSVKKNAELLVIADSNGEGWFQNSLNQTWVKQLSNGTKVVVEQQCRQGAKVADGTACADETDLISPKYAIVALGTNNARNGDTLLSFQTDYEAFINSLVSKGITPIITLIIPNGDGPTDTLVDSYNTWISTTYSSLYMVIDVNSVLTIATDFADGAHMNAGGAGKYANKIINELKVVGVIPTNPIFIPNVNLDSSNLTAVRDYYFDDRSGRIVTSDVTAGFGYVFNRPVTYNGSDLVGMILGSTLTGSGSTAAIGIDIAPTFTSVAANPTALRVRNGALAITNGNASMSSYILTVNNGTQAALAQLVSSVASGENKVDIYNSATANTANKAALQLLVKGAAGSARVAVGLKGKLSTITNGAEDSDFEITGYVAGTLATRLLMSGDKFSIGSHTPAAILDIKAGTTSAAQLRLRPGVAPASPGDGDMWTEGTDLKIHFSGTTYTISKT